LAIDFENYFAKRRFCTVFGTSSVVLLRHEKQKRNQIKGCAKGIKMKVIVSKISDKEFVQNTQAYLKDGKLAFVLLSRIKRA